jgi:hypothetical protein
MHAAPRTCRGDPSTVLGVPYARSDRFGGDVCDPDDDNDGLPDDNEPNATCRTDLDGDCDNDMLLDLWEYNESCLSITAAPTNIAVMDSDGDALINYAEGVLGTDPCVAESGTNFSLDYDGDGFKSAHERYIIQQATTYVPQAYKDPCGLGATPAPSIAWPADLASGGVPLSTDKLTLSDLTSFLAPVRYLDKSPLAPNPPPGASTIYDRRWDLIPGPTVMVSPWIQLNDLTALLAGTTGLPPMFGGTTKAFNGPTCTAPPLPRAICS